MLHHWAARLRAATQKKAPPPAPVPLFVYLEENLEKLRADFEGTSDLVIRKIQTGERECALVVMEGMVSHQSFAQGVLNPIQSRCFDGCTPEEEFTRLRDEVIGLSEVAELADMETLEVLIMSGFCAILVDGAARGLAVGMQGFSFRSVSEPSTETVQRGSREGFVEVVRINLTMVRRRLKTPDLRFEMMTVGTKSHTAVALCYLDSAVSPGLLRQVRERLRACPLESVLESGYLQPYLDDKPLSLFSGIGVSERPDTVCGKIAEGRIAVFVDGTPMVLIVPTLFIENLHSFDDYAGRPYFAAFTRILKLLAFLVAFLLPGLFVAAGTFHPALFPATMLYSLASAETNQPFSLMTEALLVNFIYELVREAGLRLPKPIGHAVGIIGGLVIGDAAVAAGIVGSPMIMIIALTALSSFVIPQLYEPVVLLRFLLILLGGTGGLPAVLLAFCVILVNLCSVHPYGIPYTAPLSPLHPGGLRDALLRQSWKKMAGEPARIQRFADAPPDEPKTPAERRGS